MYRYCRVTQDGVTVIRTVGTDGRYIYQATLGGGIVAHNQRRFDGHIGWHGAPEAPAELQIVQSNRAGDNALAIPEKSRAILVGTVGGGSMVVSADDKLGYVIYRFDVSSLLARFPAEHRLQLYVYAKSRDIPRARLTIDLDAVRRVAAAGLAAEAKLEGRACDSSWPEEIVNPAAFTDCSITVGDATARFGVSGVDYILRRTLSPDIDLVINGSGYSQSVQSGRDGGPILADLAEAMRNPFSGDKMASLDFVVRRDALPPTSWETMVLAGRGGEIGDVSSNPVRWPEILKLEAGGALGIELRDASGRVVRRVDLPPATFESIADELRQFADGLDDMTRKPMLYCQPVQDIIIT